MVTNCDEGNLKKAIDFLFEQTNMYDITAGRYFALRYLPADDPRDIIFRHPVAQRLAVELFIERQGLDYSICLNTDNGTADPYMTAVTASLMRTHMQLPPQYSRPVSAREGEL